MGHFQGMRRPLVGLAGFFGQRQEPDEDTRHIRRLLEKIMHTLEETLAAVQAARTSDASIIALLVGIKKQLDAALGGQLTPSQQMRVDAIFNEATAAKTEIDDAVKANTDGGPAPGNLVPTRAAVTSSLNPAAPGNSVTFSGAVDTHPDAPADAPAATGSITFYDGPDAIGTGNIDSTGVATFTTTILLPGDHTITAKYEGDAVYATSTSPELVQTVAAPTA